MRIGFDATNILGHGGIKTYARQLIRNLASLFPDDSFVLLSTFSGSRASRVASLFGDLKGVSVERALPHISMLGKGLGWLTGAAGALMWRMAERNLDMVHLTDPFGTASLPRAFTATIHDLFPLSRSEYAGSRLEAFYRTRTPAIMKRALALVTPSSYIARQVKELYPHMEAEIGVIPEAASPVFRRDTHEDPISLPEELAGKRYLLHVGRPDPRKNLEALLRSYVSLPAEIRNSLGLVLVPSGGLPPLNSVPGLEKSEVVILQDLPDEDLRSVYAGAAAFVFPSLDEGFGLPILEAMRCGCPVIAANVSCLPEVTGDAALLVDPANPDEIASAVSSLERTPSMREDLVKRGYERAGKFSWERTARETMELFRRIAR